MKKKLKKEVIINLSEPIEYAPKTGGEKVKSQILTIFCPTQRELLSVSVIDTIYSKYINNSQKIMMDLFGINKLEPCEITQKIEDFRIAFEKANEKKEKEGKKFKLSDMKGCITGKDLADCYGALQNILCGSAKFDTETTINSITYKSLSLIDLENILEEFIENFIIRSPQS